MKSRVIFGPYEPDKAGHLSEASVDVSNVYPIANGYGPVGSFEAVTDPLPPRFNGASAFVDSSKSGTLLAGNLTNLYRYAGGWVSVAGGFALTERWDFTQFGDKAIAVNGAATQRVDLIAGTAGALVGAPSATSVATVRDFVVYGGANGNAALVQWSGFNDETKNTLGVDQAGNQPLLDGGGIMGIAGGEYGVIIQRFAIRRMTYAPQEIDGITVPWQFDVIAPNVGALSAGSIAQHGRRVYFLSDRGFMYTDGSGEPVPIGTERIDRTFFETYSREQMTAMYAAVDPRRTTVAWLMPGAPGRLWVYNWTLDRWTIITLDALGVFSGFSSSTTLEQLDALYPGGLETIPFSLDSTRFSGGDPMLLIANISGAVGALTGGNMMAVFETALIEFNDGRSTRLRAIRPLTDATIGMVVSMDCRQRLGDLVGVVASGALMDSGDMPVRASGRYIATTLTIARDTPWKFAQGFEPIYASGGGR